VLPFALLRTRPPVSREKGADPERIAWAVRIASRFVPRVTCLVRALAGQRLLAANGHLSALHIGVARCRAATVREPCLTPPDPEPRPPAPGIFRAHAWLEYNGSVLVGAADTPYVPLIQWSGAQ
jgi:hypothetical protein